MYFAFLSDLSLFSFTVKGIDIVNDNAVPFPPAVPLKM